MNNELLHPKTDQQAVYVITWRRYDGSGSGAVCVCSTLEAAEKMRWFLATYSDDGREFGIADVPMVDFA